MTSLGLSNNQVTDISGLTSLTGLTELRLSNNQLTDISPLTSLTGLTELRLSRNQVTDISALTSLTGLTELRLSNNELTDISALTALTALTSLNLSDNKLTDISALSALTGLTSLHLSDDKLTDISALTSLTGLTRLYLSRNRLTDISALTALTGLTKLNLSANEVTHISALTALTGLTDLNLSSNEVTDISVLTSLTGLTELNLSGNEVTDISALKYLTRLTRLDLDDNQLAHISALASLTDLTRLYLDSNKLTDISALASLTSLTMLELRDNKIKNSSREFFEREWKVRWRNRYFSDGLNLYGNPLEIPPVEIVKKGREAVLRYFASLEGGRRKLNEVKILLVGTGGAGKTSLLKRIFGEPFDGKESQTKGIVIRNKRYRTGGQSIKAHFWDFGGQVIMHSSHQFFLSQRSLYILVLDGRKEEDTEHWLQLIESFGGNSPILVVLNKMDENPGFALNERFLQDKYKRILEFYRVSCKDQRKDGITGKDGIINGIRAAFGEVEMIGSEWGENWFEVKKKLEQMKKNEEHFIDSKAYQRICEDAGITDAKEQETVVDYLNDLGVILHFRDLDLADMHVLEPHWVTDAVYRIINSKKLADNHGELRASNLKTILKKRKPDDFSYPVGKHHYILQLMGKFELCYRMAEDDGVLVPDLQDVQEPEMASFGDSPLRLYFEYSFLPSSVLPRFTVRMHDEIMGELRWRTGLVVRNTDFNATAVVKSDADRKRIYIDVYGDHKREYFSCIRREFFRIHGGFRKLDVTEWIPLPDHEDEAVTYANLYGHWKAGKTEYFHGETGRSYSVSTLLDGIEKTEERIAGMFREVGIKGEHVIGKTPQAVFNIYKQYVVGSSPRGVQAEIMGHYREKGDEAVKEELFGPFDVNELARLLGQGKDE